MERDDGGIPAVPAPDVPRRALRHGLIPQDSLQPASSSATKAGTGGREARPPPPCSVVVERAAAHDPVARFGGQLHEDRHWKAGTFKNRFVGKVISEAGGRFDGDAVLFAQMGLTEAEKKKLTPECVLGKGTFGVVQKFRLPSGQEIALKTSCESAMAQRAQRVEMAVYLRVRPNKNVVSCLAMDDTQPQFPIALEFCDAGDLLRVASNHTKLTDVEKLGLLYDATLGLQHVHRHGLVHADVKPDNFLLKTLPGGGFSAKIADFGLTLAEGDIRNGQGTVGYTPPEAMYDMVRAKFNQDIFALGHTALVLLVKNQYRRHNMMCCDAVKSRAEREVWATLEGQASEQLDCFEKLLTHRNTTSGIVEAQLLREDAFEQPLARQSKLLAWLANALSATPSRRPSVSETVKFFDGLRRDLLTGESAGYNNAGDRAPPVPSPARAAGGGSGYLARVPTPPAEGRAGITNRLLDTPEGVDADHSPPLLAQQRSRLAHEGRSPPQEPMDRTTTEARKLEMATSPRIFPALARATPPFVHVSSAAAQSGSHAGGSAAQMVGVGGLATGGVSLGASRNVGGCVAPRMRAAWECEPTCVAQTIFTGGQERSAVAVQGACAGVSRLAAPSPGRGGGSAAHMPGVRGLVAGGVAQDMVLDVRGFTAPPKKKVTWDLQPTPPTQTRVAGSRGQMAAAVQGACVGVSRAATPGGGRGGCSTAQIPDVGDLAAGGLTLGLSQDVESCAASRMEHSEWGNEPGNLTQAIFAGIRRQPAVAVQGAAWRGGTNYGEGTTQRYDGGSEKVGGTQGFTATGPQPTVQLGGARLGPVGGVMGQCGTLSKTPAEQGSFTPLVNGRAANGFPLREADERFNCEAPAIMAMPWHTMEPSPRGDAGRVDHPVFRANPTTASDYSEPFPSRPPVPTRYAGTGGSRARRTPAWGPWENGIGYECSYGREYGAEHQEEYGGYWACGVVVPNVPPSSGRRVGGTGAHSSPHEYALRSSPGQGCESGGDAHPWRGNGHVGRRRRGRRGKPRGPRVQGGPSVPAEQRPGWLSGGPMEGSWYQPWPVGYEVYGSPGGGIPMPGAAFFSNAGPQQYGAGIYAH